MAIVEGNPGDGESCSALVLGLVPLAATVTRLSGAGRTAAVKLDELVAESTSLGDVEYVVTNTVGTKVWDGSGSSAATAELGTGVYCYGGKLVTARAGKGEAHTSAVREAVGEPPLLVDA